LTRLPDKQFFKIGEVSRITGVKPHVLRYWESEFSSIRPQKTKTNQRLYRRRDVELLLLVKQLLYQEGFTIAGANRRLRELHSEADARRRERLGAPDDATEIATPAAPAEAAGIAAPRSPDAADLPASPPLAALDQRASSTTGAPLARLQTVADRVRSELREILALVEGDD
jgi:DNA-binding transcriptional MerR regulator